MQARNIAPDVLEIGDAGLQSPHENLAWEECLFRACPADTIRLLFYRNTPSLVFGRNQNPWVECDVAECLHRRILLARRISGGGTVYHDEGNLNYSFSMPRQWYDRDFFLGLVAAALQRLGLVARVCERHSIWLGEKKVSGSAFMLTGRRALLHGCILVRSDTTHLRRLLHPPPRSLHARGISSVRSPVTTLAEAHPELTVATVMEAIAAAAVAGLQPGTVRQLTGRDIAPETYAACLAERRSRAWIMGRTGRFRHDIDAGAAVRFEVQVDRGIVTGVEIPEESAKKGVPVQRICHVLTGKAYDGEMLAQALAEAIPPGAEREAWRETLRREVPALQGFRFEGLEPMSGLSRPTMLGIAGQEGFVAGDGKRR